MMPGYRDPSWRDDPSSRAGSAPRSRDLAWHVSAIAYLLGLVVLATYVVHVLSR